MQQLVPSPPTNPPPFGQNEGKEKRSRDKKNEVGHPK